MGTRALTIVSDNGHEIAVLYRQSDGYPDGHGRELASFLDGMSVVNGIRDRSARTANGGCCLAAQLVANFKHGVGSFYLHSAGTRYVGEIYRYYVDCTAPADDEQFGKIAVRVTDSNEQQLFAGDVAQYSEWCTTYSAESAE